MPSVHQFIATLPFDLYELHLFQLVVKSGSFTRAATSAGLTQSAITRQMQGMETSLGLSLLERTTRSVKTTAAGEFLYQESLKLLGDVDSTMQRLRQEFAGARKQVRVGVSRTISLAYLPGFLHANLRRLPDVACSVSHMPSGEMLSALHANELDLGVMSRNSRLPATLAVTHQFEDDFCLIAPAACQPPLSTKDKASLGKWVSEQSWLLLDDTSGTGQQLRRWTRRQGWKITPAMDLDGFDLIINLVSLGMGVSFVPVRALALYGQKRTIQRIAIPQRFTRDLVVVCRRHRKVPPHLTAFIGNILFSG